MSNTQETDKRSGFCWLVGELIAEYVRTGDFALVHEFLETSDDFDREEILRFLFWYALDHIEWRLAEDCMSEGYPIAPSEDEISDCGPLYDAMSLLGDRADVIEWLLEHGAQVNRRGPSNMTPLIVAAGAGFEDIVSKLLHHGADANASTEIDEDYTPLMAAAESGHESIVRILLAHGADSQRKSRWGKDAAEIAESAGHRQLAELIRSAGRSSNRSGGGGRRDVGSATREH